MVHIALDRLNSERITTKYLLESEAMKPMTGVNATMKQRQIKLLVLPMFKAARHSVNLKGSNNGKADRYYTVLNNQKNVAELQDGCPRRAAVLILFAVLMLILLLTAIKTLQVWAPAPKKEREKTTYGFFLSALALLPITLTLTTRATEKILSTYMTELKGEERSEESQLIKVEERVRQKAEKLETEEGER